jgi:signal transduction histidine kinase
LRNSSAVFPVPQLNVSDRDYYAPLRDRDIGVFIGRFVHGRALREDTFSVARRRSSATGDFDGLIVVSVSPSYYTKFWQQVAIQNGAFGGMVRNDGAIVAREPPVSEDMLPLGVANPLMKAITKCNSGLNRDVVPLDGTERIYAIRQVPGFPVYVAYGLSVSTILNLWHDHLLTYIEFAGAATLALALVGMVALRKAQHEHFVLHQWRRTARQLDTEARQRALLEDELAQVLRRTVSDQEAERLRIARELHDTLGQSVTLFNLGLERLGPTTTGGKEFQQGLAALKDLTLAFWHDIHRLAWEIRPTALDDLGIETAIRTLLETWSERSGLSFDLHLAVDNKRLSPDVETTLYRVLQEALTNVTRHAEATRVDVVLTTHDSVITMIIEDDGRGFVTNGSGLTAVPVKRLGLLGIRERLALVRGFLEIESAPGEGTTLFIRIPR